ncbi:DUF4174 domain-containing protein [Fibrella arboris]|uniref:DUF4174 domain-containing protein n=1 Tax=Fibrella arboris TaxID=3242486 RepID=UPI0035226533
MFRLGLITSLLGSYWPTLAQSLESKLSVRKWQRRTVLIYAPDAGHKDLLSQQQLLTAQQAGIAQRDMDVLVALDSDLSAIDRKYLQSGDRKLPPSARFATYLIGKDGGVKQRFSTPVPATDLFRIIDAMPMRQSEMRGKNE